MTVSRNSPLLLPKDFYGDTKADRDRVAMEAEAGIVLPSARSLSQIAEMVAAEQIMSRKVTTVIDQLYAAASGQRKNSQEGRRKRTLVGLAAPQIGESIRIVLIDTAVQPDRKKYGELECFVNPRIVWRSRETAEDREGCFSAGSVWGLVRRSIAVKVAAFDRQGKPFERILEGFTARIAQHEIDHLDGIRFADRIRSDRKRHWVHAEELDKYPQHIQHWPRLCSREQWEAVKTGVIPTQ